MTRAIRSVSVSATQESLTGPQLCAAVSALEDAWRRGARELKHGDCVGGDAVFRCLARSFGFRVEVHPPASPFKRAFLRGDVVRLPLPYLTRNACMAREGDELIAAPRTETETLRSGTWATVRYARRYARPVTLCLPSGRLMSARPL